MVKKKQPSNKDIGASAEGNCRSKSLEEALVRSEERYRTILEQMQDSYYEVDLKGNFIFVSDSFCSNLGYAREELVGNNYRLIATEKEFKPVFLAFNQVYRTGEPNNGFINEVIRKDSSVKYYESSIAPLRNEQGKIVGFRCVGRDITGRKQLEEAVVKSEERYRTILDQMQDSYYEVDLAGNYTFVSESAGHSLGYSREELLGQNYRLTALEEDTKGIFAAFNEVYRTGKPNKGFAHRIRHKDGSIKFSEVSIDLNRNEQREVIGFKCVSRDISERKQVEAELLRSEEKYRSLVENINDVFYTLDAQGTITYVSPVVERFTKYKVSDLIGKPFIPLIYPDDLQGLLDSFNRLVSGQLEPWEFRIVDKDGRIIFVRTSSRPIYEGGQIVGITALITDITERKQAEENIRESERRFKSIIEHVNDIFYIQNAKREILYISPQVQQMLGYTLQEMQNGWQNFLTDNPMNLAGPEKSLMAITTGEKQGPYLLEFIRSDGTKRLAEINESPLKNDKGEVTGIVGAARDITERKQVEDALQESEKLYRLLAEHMTDTVWLMDMQFSTTYQSPSTEKLRGFTHQEILEMPPEKNMTPESFKLGMEVFLEEMAKVETDPDYNFMRTLDLEFYRKDGSTFWSANTFSLIRDENGRPLSILGEGRDITERRQAEQALKESEEKYRTVVENAMEGIFIAAAGMIKFANSRVAKMSGYSQEELTSRPFVEFVHPDDRQMINDYYLMHLQGTDVPNNYSFRIICKPGGIKWVDVTGALITWKGKPAILNFLNDVTDRKRLEEEQQRVEKLESVGVLAGGIAHDFNNILTAILGNISLAGMEAQEGSELHRSLEEAQKAVLRAKDLTKQLLTFSRGGAPVMKLSSLTELLKDTSDFALHGSNVKCNFSIPADLWHADIDAGQVSQVIHNLVINAQQAMPEGGTIELTAQNIALSETRRLGKGLPLKKGNYIRIAVADHGSGIPAQHMDRIFDPFFTTKQQGSGLGLATSFSIARQHGGHLSVVSLPNSGSTFYLYLPASKTKSTPRRDKKMEIKPAGKARILVMDDEKGVREVAGRMLRHVGYRDIEFAADGAEAVKLYKAAMESGNPFTVAILDLTIPGGMGGKMTVKKLHKIDPGVKAIVSSGYVDDSVIAKYKEHGFSGIVAKPYTIEELRKALQDVIG